MVTITEKKPKTKTRVKRVTATKVEPKRAAKTETAVEASKEEKTVVKSVRTTTPEAPKPKVDKAKELSPYQSQVLKVNAGLKAEKKTLGGCVKTLLLYAPEIGLDAQRVKVLRFVQKDNDAFKSFKALVRTAQYKGKDLGTYSPFFVLQALNKNLAEMTK